MKFIQLENSPIENCDLIYRQSEYSFDIEPFIRGGGNPLLVNDIQIEIDAENKLLYVWGYCPLIIYEETDHFPKNILTSSLKAKIDESIELDFPYRINSFSWRLYLNKNKGWVCIGDPTIDNIQMIEFSHRCVAALKNQELIALWLHPIMV